MRAAVATQFDAENPTAGLTIGEHPDPVIQDGWIRVHVKAASLNHHDVWTLRGVATPADRLPIVLGTDAAGVLDDGREVIVHAVIGDASNGDETLDPKRSLLSEIYDGTFAEYVTVPARNVIDKPDFLTFEEASCLPTAWLTAYRMLFTKSGLKSGDTVLIQGAGGGVATALIQLAHAAGFTVWVTSRDAGKRDYALTLGADLAFEVGAKLPGKVDAVMESVGEATWSHSMRSLRPGGRIVICGATSGANPPADLNRLFFLQLEVVGSTMGTREEFEALVAFLGTTGLRPQIQETFSLSDTDKAVALMASGDVRGKLVIVP
ncbi:MAG: zinc-binding dehydrogenase [Actinomycetes bacterium]